MLNSIISFYTAVYMAEHTKRINQAVEDAKRRRM